AARGIGIGSAAAHPRGRGPRGRRARGGRAGAARPRPDGAAAGRQAPLPPGDGAMTARRASTAMGALAGLLALLPLSAATAQKADPSSPWYLERGTAPREALPTDEIPGVAAPLVALMKDGGVPGFYDGQFHTVDGRFDELAAVAGDPDMHTVLRIMAVMALQ